MTLTNLLTSRVYSWAVRLFVHLLFCFRFISTELLTNSDHAVLSAGTAISFGVDATAQPYENENAAYFALTMLCWPSLYYVIWRYVTDTNYFLEENVIVPIHARKELKFQEEQRVQTVSSHQDIQV